MKTKDTTSIFNYNSDKPGINFITIEHYNKLMQMLVEVKTKLDQQEKEKRFKWIDNSDLCNMLHLSKRTAQHWRDTRKIGFTQPFNGNKIFYKIEDIEDILNEGYKPKVSRMYKKRKK